MCFLPNSWYWLPPAPDFCYSRCEWKRLWIWKWGTGWLAIPVSPGQNISCDIRISILKLESSGCVRLVCLWGVTGVDVRRKKVKECKILAREFGYGFSIEKIKWSRVVAVHTFRGWRQVDLGVWGQHGLQSKFQGFRKRNPVFQEGWWWDHFPALLCVTYSSIPFAF